MNTLDPNRLSRDLADQALTRYSQLLNPPYDPDPFRGGIQRGQDASLIMMGSIITMQEQLLRRNGGNGNGRKRDKVKAAAIPVSLIGVATAILAKVYLGVG